MKKRTLPGATHGRAAALYAAMATALSVALWGCAAQSAPLMGAEASRVESGPAAGLENWMRSANKHIRLLAAGTDESGRLWYILVPPWPRTETGQVFLGPTTGVQVRTLAEVANEIRRLPIDTSWFYTQIALAGPESFTTSAFKLRRFDGEEGHKLKRLVEKLDWPIKIDDVTPDGMAGTRLDTFAPRRLFLFDVDIVPGVGSEEPAKTPWWMAGWMDYENAQERYLIAGEDGAGKTRYFLVLPWPKTQMFKIPVGPASGLQAEDIGDILEAVRKFPSGARLILANRGDFASQHFKLRSLNGREVGLVHVTVDDWGQGIQVCDAWGETAQRREDLWMHFGTTPQEMAVWQEHQRDHAALLWHHPFLVMEFDAAIKRMSLEQAVKYLQGRLRRRFPYRLHGSGFRPVEGGSVLRLKGQDAASFLLAVAEASGARIRVDEHGTVVFEKK